MMKLRYLDIYSYKSIIKPVKLRLSSQLNIFIGQNNSGKTNILDALDFIFYPEKDPSRLHHYRSQISLYTDESPTPIVARGYTVTGPRKLIANKLKRLSADQPWDYEEIAGDYESLYRRHPQQYERLNQIFSQYFPQIYGGDNILDIDWQADKPLVREGTKTLLLERLGSGFQKIFIILLYALHPDYPVLLLDEPETHLHPALIKKLLKVLAKNISNQILLTTHSPLFIQPDNLTQVFRVVRSMDSGTEVYSLAGQQKQLNRNRLVQELNADNIEIFFADKVLMVEGVSDRLLMRGLIDKFYRGPLEVKVMEAHGKGNMEIYIDVLKAFHIPYVIMLDSDALEDWSAHYLAGMQSSATPAGRQSAIKELEQHNIYILPNGSIERNYPRKYQREDRKPLNALRAAAQITASEFNSSLMKRLREIIEAL